MDKISLNPIGLFYGPKTSPYEAARQAVDDITFKVGIIELFAGYNFEQALEGLEGFTHLWALFHFHLNENWKPKVLPPRGSPHKIGVFATRAPYRPNPLGMSVLQIEKIEGRKIFVKGHDLLDQTPIFDIKPYLKYADSFPEASLGWLKDIEQQKFLIEISAVAKNQIQFLESHGISEILSFLTHQLEFDPVNSHKKRVQEIFQHVYCLSYKTWRILFSIDEKKLSIIELKSGYRKEDMALAEDNYNDKGLHRKFQLFFP